MLIFKKKNVTISKYTINKNKLLTVAIKQYFIHCFGAYHLSNLTNAKIS